MMKKETGNESFLTCLPYKLAETARISELMTRNYYKECISKKGILELDEFRILSHILKNPNLSQSDLAKLEYKGKAHIGKILNSMEEQGFIKRSVSTNNNMMVKLTHITQKGMDYFEYSDEVFSALGSEIVGKFSEDEVITFMKLLDKYKDNILKNYNIYIS